MPAAGWAVVAAILLVPAAGLFAALDAALVTVSLARVEEMAKEGRTGAGRLAVVLRNRARYINLLVLLHMLCLVAASAVLAAALDELLHSPLWGTGAAVLGVVVCGYVVAGVGPRTLGRQHAYSIALRAAWPVYALGVVLGPVASLLIIVGNALTPGRGFRHGPFATEIELLEIVDMARERGVVADEESRMIQSVVELGGTTAREIMTPRTEMVWIESDKTVEQACRLAVRSGHSRIPVVGENVDDVRGVVYLRDLVARLDTPDGAGMRLTVVARPAVFVPDSKSIDALLAEMQRDHNHLAILVDEYGGIAGLVSIEDILEEIVGEIVDEYDSTEVPPVEDLGEGRYRVSARLGLDELAELFDVEFDDAVLEEVETVSGLLALELGRVPLPGAHVETGGLELAAEGGHDRRGRVRVVTVVVARRDDPGDDPPEETGSDAESDHGSRRTDGGDTAAQEGT